MCIKAIYVDFCCLVGLFILVCYACVWEKHLYVRKRKWKRETGKETLKRFKLKCKTKDELMISKKYIIYI